MSERRDIDAERLAALLDGRLGEAEREALLAELATHDDGAAALGDVAAVLRDLEMAGQLPASDLPATVPSAPPPGVPNGVEATRPAQAGTVVGEIRPRGRGTRAWWSGLAAAVLVAAVGLTTWRRGASSFDDPRALVAELSDGLLVAPSVAWGTTRGGDALSPRARAIRFGARVTDLALAARARDTSVAARAREVAALLAPLSGAAPAAEPFRAIAERPDAPPDAIAASLDDGWRAAAPLVGERDARAGAWLAAARVAALRHDGAFFTAHASEHVLDDITRAVAADPDATQPVVALRRATTSGALDWTAVERAAEFLLSRLGR